MSHILFDHLQKNAFGASNKIKFGRRYIFETALQPLFLVIIFILYTLTLLVILLFENILATFIFHVF